jgi:hypothetical protein
MVAKGFGPPPAFRGEAGAARKKNTGSERGKKAAGGFRPGSFSRFFGGKETDPGRGKI